MIKQIAHLKVGLVFGFLLTALAFDTPSSAAQGVVKTQPVRIADGESRIKWWRDARFGMFIHWGLYAIPGRGEWVQWNEQIAVKEYAKLADQFKPS
ncbi:MAG TPA: alpha-L-fucosidase, partial [Pyrinomonadaceae bacterium]